MRGDRHLRLEELFWAALEQPQELRGDFLETACAKDPEMRAAVERILEIDESQPTFLEPTHQPGRGGFDVGDSKPHSVLKRLKDRIGRVPRYEILEEFARGGMGIILRVWDRDLRRKLAMKVILDPVPAVRAEASGQVQEGRLGRFLEEAQVTGQLDHPGIVPVHELGLDANGSVFFTMKLVKGRHLGEIFELVQDGASDWTQTRALGVLLKVCEAMAYAHSKRVIHRDLKPANIMVGRFGEVYVMDWGLAHVAGREDRKDIRLRPPHAETQSRVCTDRREDTDVGSPLVTMDGDVVGTPSFMSPEQARGEIAAMGPTSDVYSLGAILYHLLAGHMPFVPPGAKLNGHAVWAMLQLGPPAPLAALAPKAPEELVAICEKAMAPAPQDRYPDMGAMAEDLRAYLEGRVVKAHRTGALAELRKWIGRNAVLAGALAAAVLLLVAGTVTSASLFVAAKANEQDALANESAARLAEKWANQETVRANGEADRANEEAIRASAEAERANTQAERAERSALEARSQSYIANFRAATISFDAGDLDATRVALDACEPDLRGWEWNRYHILEDLARRSWKNPHLLAQEMSRVSELTFSPDDSIIALATESPTFQLWDALNGQLVVEFEGHVGSVNALAFRADGSQIVSASDDGSLRVWSCSSGVSELILEGHSAEVTCVTYTPDGQSILSGSEDGNVRLWSSKNGTPLSTFPGHEGGVRDFAVVAGGSRLATVSRQGVLRLWDVREQSIVHMREVDAFAGSADLPYMACSQGARVVLCDARSGATVEILEGHSEGVYRVAFSPDGTRLVSAAWGNELRLWDPTSGEKIAVMPGHGEFVSEIAFSADRPQLITASWDKTIRFWDAVDGQLLRSLPAHSNWVNRAAIDSMASRVVSSSAGELRLWDGMSGDATVTWHAQKGEVHAVFYASDSSALLTASVEGDIAKWDAVSGAELALTTRSEGEEGTAACEDPLVVLWEERTGEALACEHHHDVTILARSADGQKIACVCSDERAAMCLWERGTGDRLANLEPEDRGWDQRITAIAFSPDGEQVVSGTNDSLLHFWSSSSGRLIRTLEASTGAVTAIVFSPGGELIASRSTGDRVQLWDAQTGRSLGVLASPRSVTSRSPDAGSGSKSELRPASPGTAGVAYSPDGSRIVAGFPDGTLCLLDGSTRVLLSVLEGHRDGVTAIAFNTDGSRLVSGSLDNTVRLWDAKEGAALAVLAGHVPEPARGLEPAIPAASDQGPAPAMSDGVGSPTYVPGDEILAEWKKAMKPKSVGEVGVTAVTFSPNGTRIVAAFVDGSLRTWLTDPRDVRVAWEHTSEVSRREGAKERR